MKQKTLFILSDFNSEHGGSILKGRRKSRRPLSTNLSHHFVLSADTSFCGSLVRHRNKITNCLNAFAEKFGVKIYRYSINSNHCHLLLKFDHRLNYSRFMRAVTGSLALKVKWLLRPYSKMISWGREFTNVDWYIDRNAHKAMGLTAFKIRKLGK